MAGSTEEVPRIFYDLHGLPALSGDDGVRFRNPVWNGTPVRPSRDILACHETAGDEITVFRKTDPGMPAFPFKVYPLVTLGENTECRQGAFEVDAWYEEGKDIALRILVSPKPLSYYDRTNPNPCDPWSMRFLEVSRWIISDGTAWVARDSFPAKPISEPKQVCLRKNAFNHLKYTVSGHTVILEVNGETIDTVYFPSYPAVGTVATADDKQVILKIVNFGDSDEPVDIILDCDVEPDYTVGLLTGKATDENSLEDPEHVHDVLLQASGASRSFTYTAPALSVNVLTMKKKPE